MVQAGAGDDGGGQEKGKAGGGAAGEAQKEGGGHGDAAAGDPGHDGQGLGEADEEGVPQADAVQGAAVPGQLFRQDEEQPHGAQEDGDAGGLAEDGFGLFLQEHPGQGPGDDGNDQKDEQAALRPVVAGGADEGVGHVQPVPAEVDQQGRQGAQVQEDVETQAAAGRP